MLVTGKCNKIFMPCEDLFLKPLANSSYGALILNSPTKMVNSNLWNIWRNGKIRSLVDGGSESWISWKNSCNNKSEIVYPHLVTGDFDSVTPETLETIKQIKSIEVIHTPDQNATDFSKALDEMILYQKRNNIKIENIYALTEFVEGRTDHIMANINTLFNAKMVLPDVSVFILSSDTISWLLMKGSHSISIPQLLRDKRKWCGLIPIGSSAIVTTSGLQWNLNKTKTEFGGLVSTSNTYDGSPNVEIETDSTLLWSMGIAGLVCL